MTALPRVALAAGAASLLLVAAPPAMADADVALGAEVFSNSELIRVGREKQRRPGGLPTVGRLCRIECASEASAGRSLATAAP